jgi:hypothetical protein
MNFSPDPFSEGLSFEDHLPCAIESRVEPPSLAERVRLNDRNFSLLKTHALEDYQRRDIDYELEGIASEIERIDQKMNLMTELLCDLLSAEAQIPAPRALAISMAGLQLRPAAGETYREGDWVILNLFLIQGVPRPLKLLARVVPMQGNALAAPESATSPLTFSFVDLSDGVASLLGRLVFRHHRREVALKRAQSGEADVAS